MCIYIYLINNISLKSFLLINNKMKLFILLLFISQIINYSISLSFTQAKKKYMYQSLNCMKPTIEKNDTLDSFIIFKKNKGVFNFGRGQPFIWDFQLINSVEFVFYKFHHNIKKNGYLKIKNLKSYNKHYEHIRIDILTNIFTLYKENIIKYKKKNGKYKKYKIATLKKINQC